ncbi:MAG: DNA gyrase inhibitor YacG [Burkholderiales bacterium]|nr:DNA gyrase inhibitor YacG [Burkholderiales bacterium]
MISVDCPTCGRKVPFTPASRWRPFCSERCKTVDLGAWAAERYRIGGDARDDGADDWSEGASGAQDMGDKPKS